MKPVNIIITFEDGSSWYTNNVEEIRQIGTALPKNIKWGVTKGIPVLRNKYFVMLDELCKAVKPGYTKTDLHEALKPLLLSKFKDFPHYYTTGVPEYSTANLTYQGWFAVIEQLKSVANDIYGYVFK